MLPDAAPTPAFLGPAPRWAWTHGAESDQHLAERTLGLIGEAYRETNTPGQILPKGAGPVGRKLLPLIPTVDKCLLEQFLWIEPCSRC